jgi:aspartyl/asparaginyl beta-hydroxylase (cupin superfamily)
MVRLHIPIITDPRIDFFVNNRKVVMNEGECWYINFNLPHRVYNNSDIDRVHLVIDCVVNDWVRSIIEISEAESEALLAARSTDAEKSEMDGKGLEQFRQLVLEDLALQEKLRETPDLKAFLDLTLQLGKDLGYVFTVEDVEHAMKESRLSWLQRWI